MFSAFIKKNMFILFVIEGQIKHCENESTCSETFIVSLEVLLIYAAKTWCS